MPATPIHRDDIPPPAAGWRRITPFVLLLTTALMIACQSTRQANELGVTPETGPTTVEVDNRGFPDLTIYVIDGGRRERLGVASGHAKTTLLIPARLVARATTLKFISDPIGGPALPVTDEIGVAPGDVVSLIILDH